MATKQATKTAGKNKKKAVPSKKGKKNGASNGAHAHANGHSDAHLEEEGAPEVAEAAETEEEAPSTEAPTHGGYDLAALNGFEEEEAAPVAAAPATPDAAPPSPKEILESLTAEEEAQKARATAYATKAKVEADALDAAKAEAERERARRERADAVAREIQRLEAEAAAAPGATSVTTSAGAEGRISVEFEPPAGVSRELPPIFQQPGKTPQLVRGEWIMPLDNVRILPGKEEPVILSVPENTKVDLTSFLLHSAIRSKLLLRQIYHSGGEKAFPGERDRDMPMEWATLQEGAQHLPRGIVITHKFAVVLRIFNPTDRPLIVVGTATGTFEQYKVI